MAFMICKTLEACSLLPKENCMKILLIGASGTIGRAVHALLAPRHDIVTVGRSSGDLRADFTQPETLQKMFEAAGQVDAIVSTAGNLHFGPLSEMTAEQFNTGLQDSCWARCGWPCWGSAGCATAAPSR
jgi:short-subunit dehydrogenase